MLAAAATAAAALAVSIPSFQLEQVNSEVFTIRSGGSHPLCQAIPITVVRTRLRYQRGPGKARVSFAVPGHRARARTVTLKGRRGTRVLHDTPQTLGLRDGAFPEGRYVVTVRDGSKKRLARATFRLTGGRTC